uniref:Uncharacterized protein n=1 Tax=Heterorhabditis bacteriophora TaxID=37862 RepID=A0A1I7WEL0_HETBA
MVSGKFSNSKPIFIHTSFPLSCHWFKPASNCHMTILQAVSRKAFLNKHIND